MTLTPFHAKFYAYELTRGCPPDSDDRLAGALVDARVEPPSDRGGTARLSLAALAWRAARGIDHAQCQRRGAGESTVRVAFEKAREVGAAEKAIMFTDVDVSPAVDAAPCSAGRSDSDPEDWCR
jgi:hypothetical protein